MRVEALVQGLGLIYITPQLPFIIFLKYPLFKSIRAPFKGDWGVLVEGRVRVFLGLRFWLPLEADLSP